MEHILETYNISKNFGKTQAVKNVNIKIQKGIIFSLLGPNGAGKTTLINILCTLLKPSIGTAKICGFDIMHESSKVREKIGLVPQHTNLYEDLTARENLIFQGKLYGLPKNVIKDRIDALLDLVELKEKADDIVKTFSGGMKRRLLIARALINEPEILFLDEPTIGLDPQSRRRIWNYILRLKKEKVTVFLTTHYMEEADHLSDKVAIIDKGEIKIYGSPYDLKKLIDNILIIESDRTAINILKNAGYDIISNDHKIKVRIIDKKEILKILNLLMKCELEISYISFKEASLEDVFLSVVGKSASELKLRGKY